jgi:hypothetical protein
VPHLLLVQQVYSPLLGTAIFVVPSSSLVSSPFIFHSIDVLVIEVLRAHSNVKLLAKQVDTPITNVFSGTSAKNPLPAMMFGSSASKQHSVIIVVAVDAPNILDKVHV